MTELSAVLRAAAQRQLEVRGELPTTPAGKIAKAQLRGEVVVS